MRIGLAADHGGLELKEFIAGKLRETGHDVVDFGATEYNADDDYPDFVIPLARAVADHTIERGIAVCGSGVGACVAANKIAGVRAGMIHEIFSGIESAFQLKGNYTAASGLLLSGQIILRVGFQKRIINSINC